MATAYRVVRNLYRDSVSMMQLSAVLRDLPGVEQASATMATAANLDMLREAGMLDGDPEAGTSDLLVVVKGNGSAALEAALVAAEAELRKSAAVSADGGGPRALPPASLQMALARAPDANLALISTPGEYAAAEAAKALRLGLNVMLFSDNVPVEDEVALKKYGRDHGLLVMGPDCGTAIVDGVPLGFANVVRRGAVGVVGASGTGTQQVTCLVHRQGQGISQALGTGGRDLKTEVGGITMLQGLDALARDKSTRVIVLISKPPAPEVAARVLAAARKVRKPVVVNFVGAGTTAEGSNLHFASTLDDAARAAVALAQGRAPSRRPSARVPPQLLRVAPRLARGQRYLRGLYSGGTFCYEACALLRDLRGAVRSNAPVDPQMHLADVWQSAEHTVIDLGDDEFTRGRAHPMIDQTLRTERLLKEAADPSVAVILLDVVLGYGAHPDPATPIAAAIEKARRQAARRRRRIAFVGFICGTDGDPQDYARQDATLRGAGMILADSNAQAVRVAAAIVHKQETK
jgi:succinyl-CoA synthetase alpha subunit